MNRRFANINQSISSKTENIIYLIIWMLAFIGPIFTMANNDREINWTQIYVSWIRLLPFLIIFFVNNAILLPYLLLKKRLPYYLISLSILVVIVVVLSPHLRVFINWVVDLSDGTLFRRRPLKTRSDVMGERAIMSILVIGMNNTIKLLIQRQKQERQHEEQKKLLLQTELSFLRNQISPHFFMNTLNNIHALIEIDPQKAGKSIIQLSELMRHMLSEGIKEKSTIKAEFDFLNSYISLMKLRCSKRVKIEVDFHIQDNEQLIPSFLFVSIVENAFKYGVDYVKPSFISIAANVVDQTLVFIASNSKNSESEAKPTTGLGLNNLRKQLDLLFKTNYELTIFDNDDTFTVDLKIPLNND